MPEKHFRVEVESDHLRKVAAAKPVPAIAELIWNSVDADAMRVDVRIDADDLAMRSITIADNGHGIPHNEIGSLFGKLGGSWKRHGNRSKSKGRILHGKEGKGRFKALGIGRVVDWTIRFRDKKSILQYSVSIIRDDLTDVRVSEPVKVSNKLGTGVEVRVSELDREYRSLAPERAVPALSEIFALYLTDYSDVSVFFESEKLNPEAAIADRRTIKLASVEWEDETYAVSVEVIEWNTASERWFFFCGDEGFPFHRISPRFHAPGFNFSAYLKSRLVSDLNQKGLLELAEMNPQLLSAVEEAAEKIKAHFHDKETQAAQNAIEQWKAEKIYPYKREPESSVEQAERKVFDIVALNVKKHVPDFSEASKRAKAFQLRMLRQAIERGPEELQTILTEVLDLPELKQRELAKLLEEADLANIISASKLVADRLKFLNGLEALLFDPDTKKTLKERSQLHRIIADNNTWVFGEEFNLTVDDQSLTQVLRKHRKLIGADTVIDGPVKRVDGKKGIVDLMLSRSVPRNHADEREHLVIELKRPKQNVGADEITQIKNYAYAVAEDERFRHLKTRWSFWVISNDLDKFAQKETRQKNKPRGQVFVDEDGQIDVWVKTWSELIEEGKARLRFVDEKLKANIDRESSLRYLRKTYEKYLSGVTTDEDEVPSQDKKVDAA